MIKKMDINNIPYDLLLLADPSKEKIDEYLNGSHSYIYEIAGIIVGVCVYKELSKDTFEIMNIAIHPEYQGRGLAKKFINFVIDKVKEVNAKELLIGTGNSSINQLALYQKCGFRIFDISKDFFKNNYEEEIWENGIKCIDMIRLHIEF